MQSLRNTIKTNSHLPITIYLIAVVLYGLWSTMLHLHWSLPFIMVGLAVYVSPMMGTPYLALGNMAVAAVMAIYGLSQQLGLAWYAAAVLVVGPLVALVFLTKIVQRHLGVEQDSSAPQQ